MVEFIGIGIILIGILGGLITALVEHRQYNKGICKCGGTFKMFDTDSQGGTGWKCDECKNYLWTSWVKVKG